MKINAQLKINGTIIPISSFTYRAPVDRLGASLDIECTIPDRALTPRSGNILFELLVTKGATTSSFALVKDGRMAGRDFRIAFSAGNPVGKPNDSLKISCLNPLADRWTLAPRRPVVMYDPDKVSFQDVKQDARSLVIDESGAPILPIYEPVGGLDLYAILNRAYTSTSALVARTSFTSSGPTSTSGVMSTYVETNRSNETGCGFARVITNIPNYVIPRADFGDDGWHAGASPFVAMYNPLYFADDFNNLFIIDPERPLPAGFSARALPLHCVIEAGFVDAPVEITNAAVVTYKGTIDPNATDEFYTETLKFDPQTTSGTYGSDDYSETDVYYRVRQWRKVEEPNVIIREQIIETHTSVHAMADIFGDGSRSLTLAYREVQTDRYDGLWKIGYRKVIEALVPEPTLTTNSLLLQTAITEIQEIIWLELPRGAKEMYRTTTRSSGLVLVERDENDHNSYIPYVEAYQSGRVTTGGDGAQSIDNRPIKTTIESMRPDGNGQIDIVKMEMDHLSGSSKSATITRPYNNATITNSERARTLRMMIRDAESEELIGTRRPLPINAGELPPQLAIPLARLRLARQTNPLRDATITLPAVDFSIHRGSLRRPDNRTGSEGLFLVTGYEITGRNLGQLRRHQINQVLTCREVANG